MGLELKTFERFFEKFSTTTVIRVFNFIRISTFRVERLFWILVLVGFTSATAWSVTQTVSTFLSEPTASQVSFGSNVSAGLIFPKAIMCMQIKSQNLEWNHGSKVSDVINKINTAADLHGSLKAKIDKIHQAEQQRAASLLKQLEVLANLTTLSEANKALYNYHATDQSSNDAFSENEVALLGLTTAMFVYLTSLEMHPMLHTTSWPSSKLQKLHEAYVKTGTNFSKLFDQMAEMLCVRLQIRMVMCHPALYDESIDCVPYNFCRLFSSPVFFGRDAKKEAICYPLGGNDDPPLQFKTPYDSLTITFNTETLYTTYVDLRQNSFHFNGNLAVDDPPLLIVSKYKQIAEFNLETVSTAVDLRRRGCFDRKIRPGTSGACQSWCRVESVVWACNCMPLTRQVLPQYSRLPEGLPSCAVKAFADADKKCHAALSQYGGDYSNCSQQCFNQDCEKFFFINSVQQGGYDPALYGLSLINVSTAVILTSTKFIYQKVDEYLTMDSIALIGSLGGNLSLYLGASFLALIHIVVFFVKLPFEVTALEVAPNPSRPTTTKKLESSSTNSHLEAQIKILVDGFSRMRRDLRTVKVRLDLVDLERKLTRATLQELRTSRELH